MSKILIATPAYGGNCSIVYARSLFLLMFALHEKGHTVQFVDMSNESLINRARNSLTKVFLETDNDYLLFIDSDEGFDAQGVIKMIEEDVDIIGAVVPLKTINWKNVLSAVDQGKTDLQNYTSLHNVNMTEDQIKSVDVTKKIEVKNVGTGLMLIKRSVFEKMIPTTPYYFSSQEYDKNSKVYNFWNIGIDEDSHLLSEDYYFCKKWTELGGKVYACFYPRVTHIGTYEFK